MLGRRANVVGVFVKPEHRGSGTVDALFDAAKEFAKEQGFVELRLEVHSSNARARAAYERVGFEETGAVIESDSGCDVVMVASLR